MRGDLLVLGSAAALAAGSFLSRRGSSARGSVDPHHHPEPVVSRIAYRQETPDHEVTGIVADPVWAFNHVAWPMLDQDYWAFVGVDADNPDCMDLADDAIAEEWARRGRRPLTDAEEFGRAIGPSDRVFAWDTLYVQGDRRGAGLGRKTVERIEAMFRADGIRAVILQAGQLDPGLLQSSEMFWRRMGYGVWPGVDYTPSNTEDKIMVKVLS